MFNNLFDLLFGGSESDRLSDTTAPAASANPITFSAVDFSTSAAPPNEASTADYSNAWHTACPNQVTAECGSAFASHDFTATTYGFDASSAWSSCDSGASSFDTGSSFGSSTGCDPWP